MCVHRVSLSSVCAYERRLRDRLWLDWCPSPDESEFLMCQQGWIMHSPPLPLFSSSLLHLLSWVVRLSFHHSCHIWRHLHPLHPSPLFLSSPYAKDDTISPHCCCRCLTVLWSILLPTEAANSFVSSSVRFQVKFYRVFFVEVYAHSMTRNVFLLFCWHFALKMAKCVDVHSSLSN